MQLNNYYKTEIDCSMRTFSRTCNVLKFYRSILENRWLWCAFRVGCLKFLSRFYLRLTSVRCVMSRHPYDNKCAHIQFETLTKALSNSSNAAMELFTFFILFEGFYNFSRWACIFLYISWIILVFLSLSVLGAGAIKKCVNYYFLHGMSYYSMLTIKAAACLRFGSKMISLVLINLLSATTASTKTWKSKVCLEFWF